MAKIYIGGNRNTERKVLKWNKMTPIERYEYISSPTVRAVKTDTAKWKRILRQL